MNYELLLPIIGITLSIFFILKKWVVFKPLMVLSLNEPKLFKLIEKRKISHNTYIFVFSMPSKHHIFNVPVGQHVQFITKDQVKRSYTPISVPNLRGKVEFLIKVYDPCEAYPSGGVMSQYIHSLALGDSVLIKGPLGRFQYLSEGKYRLKQRSQWTEPTKTGRIILLGGGTGITPLFQVIQSVLNNAPKDKTRLVLLYTNHTVSDILLKPQLDEFAKLHTTQFKCFYTVTRSDSNEAHFNGYVNTDIIQSVLDYSTFPDDLFLLCGPPGFVKHACQENLLKLGLKESQIIAL